MKILIRTDASVKIGTGHVMRCLTLAEQLRKQGADVAFISRMHEGNLNSWIRVSKGFPVYELPTDLEWQRIRGDWPLYKCWLGTSLENDVSETKKILLNYNDKVDWLIVDHYALDIQWEKALRSYVGKIMVIDDLANRSHDCDVLLDQNLYKDMYTRYDDLVPLECQRFLGPTYALLRKEFIEARKKLRLRNGRVRRILIFFGGSDPTNETMKALDALTLLQTLDLSVDVVVGRSNPNREQIEKRCVTMCNVNYYCQVDNMAELMAHADLAIGAGGTTTWERCCLGLPAIVVAVAANQIKTAEVISGLGAIKFLGMSDHIDAQELADIIQYFVNHPNEIMVMQQKSIEVMGDIFENKLYNLFL
jgi:UDP-2,4-diacetamido-2,4,6-trideoxy-beta-L-altropyranose hydrolase